jgi:hypothetical protein
MPSVDTMNMPPNSQDVGFCAPSTAMNPIEASSMATGSRRSSSPDGTTRSGSGGGSRTSSPPGTAGTTRSARDTAMVPMLVPHGFCGNAPPAGGALRC